MRAIQPFLTVLIAGSAIVGPAAADEVVLPASRDVAIYAESGNESNGAGSHFHVGMNGLTQARRSLLRFDVAAGVPAGATITAVEITLHLSMTNSGPQDIRFFRVLADWGEGTSNPGSGEGSGTGATTNDATWTKRFHPNVFWTNFGGDFDPNASALLSVDQVGDYTWSGVGLVADVQSMLDAPSANFGWLLQNGNEMDSATAKRFDSRQNASTSVRPRMRVVYDPPCVASASNYCVASPNSTGQGASIGWSGSLSVAANAFTLTCAQMPPNTPHLFFFGTQTVQSAFGNGFRCAAGSVARLNPPAPATPAGTTSRYVDLAAAPALGNIAPGSTRYFQCWYRNPAAGGAGFNLSDGLAATFCN